MRMQQTQNFISVNINIDAFEAFLEFHINKAVATAIANLDIQKSNLTQHDDWITRKQAITILGISAPTIINWSKSGIIPCYRIGSLVRYKRSEIEESLKQMRTTNSRKR
jgi:excisionase family DNA binding protein